MAPEKILIGVGWPYANGSLHLGHAAGSLLPADIFARYNRLRGRRVLMVSGSDEHGTPITVTAERRGQTPAEVAEAYHKEHVDTLEKFGIKFDLFFRTSDRGHKEVVWDIFRTLLEKGYIYKKEVEALHCARCNRFLPDRYVEGVCPRCGADGARGDQCEACGRTLDPTELVEPRCRLCGSAPEARRTEHFFLRLSALQPALEDYLRDRTHWRPNTINFTRNWLREGLRDRAITRDLSWGVEIPLPGYESKRIYVWFEAVIGYLSASKEWARRRGRPEEWREFWQDPAARHYYFIGKDNVPFHTIVWPGILIGYGGLNLPYDVPANEFLSFGGEKFSKSRGVGIELPAYLARFDPDPMRYYLTINMPELHDTDFSWEEFVRKNNDELVGTLGNFINRVLTFTFKHFQRVPEQAAEEELDRELFREVEAAYHAVERHLEACEFKSALKAIMNLAQFGNRYIDTRAPWKLIREDKTKCGGALHNCLRLTKALCVLMEPFLPFTARRLWAMLGEEGDIEAARWEDGKGELPEGRRLPKPEPLFRKLELDEVLGAPARAPAGSAEGGDGASQGSGGAVAGVVTGTKGAGGGSVIKGGGAGANRAEGESAMKGAGEGMGKKGAGGESLVKGEKEGSGVKGAEGGGVVCGAEAGEPASPEAALESGRWFDRASLRVGKVLEVAAHPSADRLYICKVDIGTETRQLVAGMRQHYRESELAGRSVVVVTNLEPARLRGVESNGMILAFDEEGGKRIALVVPAGDAAPGERVLALGRPPGTPAKSMSIKEFGRIDMRAGTVLSVRGAGDGGSAEGETGGVAEGEGVGGGTKGVRGEAGPERMAGWRAEVEVGGRIVEVGAPKGLGVGMCVAVLMVSPPAILVTEKGVLLTSERSISSGARVR
ncbi:MAG: methionine--tRNA ligase [Thermoplasmata archaeon]